MSWDWAVVAVSGVATIAFIIAFRYSGLVTRARDTIALTRETTSVMADPALDDLEKEKRVQAAAIGLFKQFALITIAAALVLAAPGLVIWAADLAAIATATAVTDFLLRWDVIIGLTVLVCAGVWIVRRF